MVVICLLVGCLMVAGGVTAVTTGMGFIVLERGWSMVIAGSVVATGGALLIGIALLIREIRRLPMQLATYDQPEEWEEADRHAHRADGASHEEHAAGYESVNALRREAAHDALPRVSAADAREGGGEHAQPPVRPALEPAPLAPVADVVPAAVRGSIAGAAATAALATAAPVVVAAATRRADAVSGEAPAAPEMPAPMADAGPDRTGLDRALASVEEAFAASFEFAPAKAGKSAPAEEPAEDIAQEDVSSLPADEKTEEPAAAARVGAGGREPAVDRDAFFRDLTAQRTPAVEPAPAVSAPEAARPSMPSWFSPSRFSRTTPPAAPESLPEAAAPDEPPRETVASGERDAVGFEDSAAEVASAGPSGVTEPEPERPAFPDLAVSRDVPPAGDSAAAAAPDMALSGAAAPDKTPEQTPEQAAAERKARWSLFRRRSEPPATAETDAERAARIAAAALAVTPNRSFAGEELHRDTPVTTEDDALSAGGEPRGDDAVTREAPWRGMTPVNEERAYLPEERSSAPDDDRLPVDTTAPLADEDREPVRPAIAGTDDDDFFSGGRRGGEEALPERDASLGQETPSLQPAETEALEYATLESTTEVVEELTVEDEPASSDFVPDPVPTVVGTYSAGGNLYVMFSDGSIEAETSRGTYRFGSLDELKAYVAASEEGGESGEPGDVSSGDDRQETEEGNVPWTTPKANA
ncbi:hypothetical protein [Chelatococcus asaccharovorans]|uniref:Uncharacterized protein n=1 Tax=Chelatococcus asaccharovorans TaxID=28210 RepID=A0A2V3U1X8_9HYPH|nr:hypothetical protein [Chelatococcus asaccharovorans]MBS7702492.1 hypothetical protein [Chelatococcus asaccharovorans]PXW56299.1 hypothetical protein C7450_10848 [Chelatococcus asaccharovorans]